MFLAAKLDIFVFVPPSCILCNETYNLQISFGNRHVRGEKVRQLCFGKSNNVMSLRSRIITQREFERGL